MTFTTEYSIGDRFIVRGDRWEFVITAITIRASGEVEYCLEWVGNASFNSEWITGEKMKLLQFDKIEENKGEHK